MNQVGKTVGLNLLALFAYLLAAVVYTRLTSKPDYAPGDYLGFATMAITAHVFACLGIGIFFYVKRNSPAGNGWILSMLAVLLIGFSACLGGASLAYGVQP